MGQFWLYLKLGIQHITDIYAVDHILFLLALSVIFLFKDWKKVLILITIFTIGHSLTLVMAILEIFKYNQRLMEFLLPATIFVTAVSNLLQGKENYNIYKNVKRNYVFATVFGLIHGLSFADYLRGILANEPNVTKPLIAFNFGIEVGQAIVVALILVLSTIFIGTFNFSRRDWVMVISSAIAGVAMTLMFESKYW